MPKILSFFMSVIYSVLSLFGLSFNDGHSIWSKDIIIVTENKSDIFYPDENVWLNGCQYPSVIELENGTVLTTFEVFDKGRTGFRIMAGNNKGETWVQRSFVTESSDDTINAAWNPCLFCLPENVGQYKRGTVVLAAVSVDPNHSVKSRISVYVSEDDGFSWSEINAVDEAGGLEEGVWEPYLIYDNGYIYCFYSDDSDDYHSQTILYKRTSDLVTWEDKSDVVVSDNSEDRPGMPVITKMGNGKWFLCYEFGNGDGYPVYYKTSDSPDNWNASDKGKIIMTKSRKTINSAPSCIWIPDGGKYGTLIVSGKYGNSKNNDLFISTDYGNTFTAIKNPLEYSDKQGFGYHTAFFYSSSDNKLLYANTVDYTDILAKISFARLTVKEKSIKEIFQAD